MGSPDGNLGLNTRLVKVVDFAELVRLAAKLSPDKKALLNADLERGAIAVIKWPAPRRWRSRVRRAATPLWAPSCRQSSGKPSSAESVRCRRSITTIANR